MMKQHAKTLEGVVFEIEPTKIGVKELTKIMGLLFGS